jgi:hypothetical protein
MTQGTEDDGPTTAGDPAAADAASAVTGQHPHPFTGEPEEPARDEPDDDPDVPDAEPPGTAR